MTHAEVVGFLNFTITSIDTYHTQKLHNRLAHVTVKGLNFLNDKGVLGKYLFFHMLFCVIIMYLTNIIGCHFHLAHTRIECCNTFIMICNLGNSLTFGGNEYFVYY